MSDEVHSESELYYPDGLKNNTEFTALNYERVGAGQDEGNSQAKK